MISDKLKEKAEKVWMNCNHISGPNGTCGHCMIEALRDVEKATAERCAEIAKERKGFLTQSDIIAEFGL